MVSLPDGLRPEISRGSQIFWMLWSVSSIETEIIVVYNAVTKKTVRTRLRLKPRQWSPRPRRRNHQRLLAILIYYTQHSNKKTVVKTILRLKPRQWSPRPRRSNHQRLVAILIYYTQRSNKKTVRTRPTLKPRQWSPRQRTFVGYRYASCWRTCLFRFLVFFCHHIFFVSDVMR